MTLILDLIEQIGQDDLCIVVPKDADKDENIPENMPEDLQAYFRVYQRINLFPDSDCPIEIVSLQKFERANKIILDEEIEDDASNDWYVIGVGLNSQYITIDLSQAKLGYCYDSFWDRYGLVGDMPVIAKSFSELLDRLYQNKGKCYWLEADFESYGDAYDDV